MFERFSEEARAVVTMAQERARELGHGHIGCEHFLLALTAPAAGAPHAILARHGVDAGRVRDTLVEFVPAGADRTEGQIPFTPRAKKTLELALRRCLSVGCARVESEHLLYGLVRTDPNTATQILGALGVDADLILTELDNRRPVPEPVLSEARRRWKAARLRHDDPLHEPLVCFEVRPSAEVTRLLMRAGAKALQDGRTEITLADVSAAETESAGDGDPPQAAAG